MLLVIAPTDGGILKIFLVTRLRRAAHERDYLIRSHRFDGILSSLVKFCRQHKISFSDLDGIAVLNSAGSFTTTRLSVSLANIIGWIYGLRIISLRSMGEIASLELGFGFRGFVKPAYIGVPNITHAPVRFGPDSAWFAMKQY